MWSRYLGAFLLTLVAQSTAYLQFVQNYMGYVIIGFVPEQPLSCAALLFIGQESSYSHLGSRVADVHGRIFVTIDLADSEPTHTFEQIVIGVKTHLVEWMASRWGMTAACGSGGYKWVLGGHGAGGAKMHQLVAQYGTQLTDAEFHFALPIDACTLNVNVPSVLWTLDDLASEGCMIHAPHSVRYTLKKCEYMGTMRFHEETLSNDPGTLGYFSPKAIEKAALSIDRLFAALEAPRADKWLSAFFSYDMPWPETCSSQRRLVLDVFFQK